MFDKEIREALRKAGLNESLAGQIKVEKEDEIAAAVKTLATDLDQAKKLTGDEFLEALDKAGLREAYDKQLASDTDRRTNQYVETQKKATQKIADDAAADAKAKAKKKEDQNDMTDSEKRYKALEDKFDTLLEKFDGVSTKLSTGDLNAVILKELKAAGMGEEFVQYVKVDDPEKVGEAVKELKNAFDGNHQQFIDDKIEKGELTSVQTGKAGATVEQEQIKDYASSLGVDGAVKNPDFQGKLAEQTAGTT